MTHKHHSIPMLQPTTLRLLVTKKCNRKCKGCCNKDWDLDKLPFVDSYLKYSEICITGGEPMLFPERVIELVSSLKALLPETKVVVYTADISNTDAVDGVLRHADGLTYTIHDMQGIRDLVAFQSVAPIEHTTKSLRLHIFRDLDRSIPVNPLVWSEVKLVRWIRKCPLPAHESFRRLRKLWR